MNATNIVSILLIACAAGSVQARDIAATVDLGTTGLGMHVTTPLAAKLNGRIGVNVASTSYEGSTSDLDYDFKLKLKTADALLDYHPLDGSFRITGGVVYNGNKIDARAKPSGGTYTINNIPYNAATVGDLSSKIEFRKASPYLGIGWGNAVKAAGWSFGTDLGIIFQGTPKSQLASNNCTALPIVCSRLASDVAAENVKLGEEVKDFKLYPVIRIGVSYRF